MFWLILVLAFSVLAALALRFYLRRSVREGDHVLAAHGLILLVGLVLACIGVVSLKFSLI